MIQFSGQLSAFCSLIPIPFIIWSFSGSSVSARQLLLRCSTSCIHAVVDNCSCVVLPPASMQSYSQMLFSSIEGTHRSLPCKRRSYSSFLCCIVVEGNNHYFNNSPQLDILSDSDWSQNKWKWYNYS